MLFVCHPKILHKHCLQFLLGVIPRLHVLARLASLAQIGELARRLSPAQNTPALQATELQVQRSDHSATLPPHAVTKSCSEVTTDRALSRN